MGISRLLSCPSFCFPPFVRPFPLSFLLFTDLEFLPVHSLEPLIEADGSRVPPGFSAGGGGGEGG